MPCASRWTERSCPTAIQQIFRPSDVLLSSEEDVVRSLDVVLYFPEVSSQQLLAAAKDADAL